MSKIETIKYLINNPVPVVVGPGKKLYMVDHHHLCFAFDLIGQKEVVYKIIGDLSDSKTPLEFWSKMINEGNIYGDYKWAYDHDENGNKLSVNEFIRQIGSTIRVMRDDPFRSIAGRLRDSGDYTKQPTDYFIEFVIANYLRSIISYKKRDSWYDKAFKKGEKILNSTLGNTRKCSKIMETLSAY